MATYYKYEKADDISKSMIDWSGLTKTISDNLMGEKKKRDELKQKHNLDNAKQLQELDTLEQGLSPTFNAKMTEFTQNYKQFLLENHKLMKRGLITVNDAMLIKQNSKDSFANMSVATKTFNKNIKAIIDKGGNVNDFKAEFAAELFDFKDKKLFVNDQGVASLANVDDKGDIDKNTLVPWTTLNNTMMQPHETFDLKTKVAAAITNTAKAEWTTAPSPYLSITDQRAREKEFKEWKKNTITSVLAGESTLIAAAADQDMKPTKDWYLVESNPEEYFLAEVVNGEIKFSLDSTQEEKLREKVGNEIEMSLGRTEVKKESTYKPTQGETTSINTARLIDDFVTKGQFSGLKAVLGNVANNVVFDKDNKELTVFMNEGNTRTVDLTQPARDVGVEIAGIINPDFAGAYRNRGTSSLKSGVNTSVFNNDLYGRISERVSISDDSVNDMNKSFQGSADMTGDMVVNEAQVKNSVSSAARSLGLDPNKVTVKIEGDSAQAFYDGKPMGGTGASVADKLQEIKQGIDNTGKGKYDNVNKKGE